MPRDGNQLDELLSGFIDGQLTASERQQVEEAIDRDPSIAEHLEQLRRQSLDLRAVGTALIATTSSSSLESQLEQALPHASASSLSSRVVELAQRRAEELGLPAGHYLRSSSSRAEVAQQIPATASSRNQLRGTEQPAGVQLKRWLAAGALAATAATVLVIATLRWQPTAVPTVAQQAAPAEQATRPAFPAPADMPQTERLANSNPSNAQSDLTISPVDSNLVGRFGAMSMVLVVDVQITSQALRSGAIDKILATAGIPLAPAVSADHGILKALDESRLVVRGKSGASGEVFVHVVRGDMHELDPALRQLWQDRDSFPNVSLNVSIDAHATLAREILRSLGDRYSSSDRFAVPLVSAPTEATADNTTGDGIVVAGSSPFPSSGNGQRYISSSQRAHGWSESNMLPAATAASQSDAMVTILLVLHRVD